MIITAVTAQQKDKNRINVMVDGKYRFSLDIFQYADLGVKVGKDYTEEELIELETESQFGKVYMRALEYCLMRPHSAKEMRDYLYRKTRPTKHIKKAASVGGGRGRTSAAGQPSSGYGEIVERPGVPEAITQRVFDRLVEKNYIDDEKFARFWIENRNLRKGTSQRKLQAELRAKGVDGGIIERLLAESNRHDDNEITKIIAKKRARYPDDQKLMQYLARQGFSYDDIKQALSSSSFDD